MNMAQGNSIIAALDMLLLYWGKTHGPAPQYVKRGNYEGTHISSAVLA